MTVSIKRVWTVYSEVSLRRTPLEPTKSVRLREVFVLKRIFFFLFFFFLLLRYITYSTSYYITLLTILLMTYVTYNTTDYVTLLTILLMTLRYLQYY